MSTLVELDGVSMSYRGAPRPALQPFSWSADEAAPRIMAIVGESGSGKTTLGNILLGLLAPTTGTLSYRGRELGRLAGAEFVAFRREVQAIAQDPFAAYNPFYTVDRALIVPIRKFKLAGDAKTARRLIEQACISVGLNPDDTLGRYPHQLSGGQRQRLMVARALLLRPRLLVADEPVSMVDASLRATILGNIAELNRVHGIAVVYITHDIMTAYHVADSICVLYRGHLVEAGDAASVIESPQHPYTQLLVSSIPWPEPGKRWGRGVVRASSRPATDDRGCPFAARCPRVERECTQVMPKLRRSSPGGVAACHLLEQAAPLGAGELAGLLQT